MENQAKSNDVVTPIERACIHAAQDMFRLIHFLDWGSFTQSGPTTDIGTQT